jgi:hypothetical protein
VFKMLRCDYTTIHDCIRLTVEFGVDGGRPLVSIRVGCSQGITTKHMVRTYLTASYCVNLLGTHCLV